MSNGVWFASESTGQGIWALSESTAAVPTLTAFDPVSGTELSVSWTDSADEYRLNGGAAQTLVDTTSPATISGLTPNTEYTIELRYLGGAWSSSLSEFTDNTGGGGGTVSSSIVEAAGAATASAVAGASRFRGVMAAGAGVATASALAGSSTAISTIAAAAGIATASALVGDSNTISIAPAAGLATTSVMVGSSVAVATMAAAAGAATSETLRDANARRVEKMAFTLAAGRISGTLTRGSIRITR